MLRAGGRSTTCRDIDHVLCTLQGLVAVETKHIRASFDLTREVPPQVHAACRQSRWGADLLRTWTRYPLGDVTVRSVVVFWGRRIADVPGGTVDIDGVTVCVGRQYRGWRRHLCGEPLTAWQVDVIAELVHGYVARHDSRSCA